MDCNTDSIFSRNAIVAGIDTDNLGSWKYQIVRLLKETTKRRVTSFPLARLTLALWATILPAPPSRRRRRNAAPKARALYLT